MAGGRDVGLPYKREAPVEVGDHLLIDRYASDLRLVDHAEQGRRRSEAHERDGQVVVVTQRLGDSGQRARLLGRERGPECLGDALGPGAPAADAV